MVAQSPSELLDRLDLRAHRTEGPVLDERIRTSGRHLVPQELQVLFEQIGPRRSEVVAKEVGQLDTLSIGEILGPFQQAPPAVFEHGLEPVAFHPSHLVRPDLVDGLVQLRNDVEAVEHMDRLLRSPSQDVEVRLPHVAAYEPKPPCSQTKLVEECIEALCRTVEPDPQQTTAMLVDLVDGRRGTCARDARAPRRCRSPEFL